MSKLGKFAAACAAVVCAFCAAEVRAADQVLEDGGDLAAAIGQANDGDTITLGEGTYACESLSVTKAITIRGAGAASVLAAGANSTAITLNNAGAVLEDVGFSGTKANGFINVSAGTCRRVTVAGITEQGKVFNVTGADAVLDDCCATNIFRTWAGQGYILYQSAGLVKNSRFVDMYGPDEAVNISGGTISNCLIKGMIDNNRNGSSAGNGQSFAALKVNGSNALVTHSRIVENGKKNSAQYGMVLLSSGTVRNCLIADNVVKSYGAVVLSGSGRLENCTVAGTIRNNPSQNGLSLHMTGGTAVNNIFDDGEHGSASVYVSSGTFATNLVPVAVSAGVGNKVGSPYFIDPEFGDYTPAFSSAAVNAGDLLPWMVDGATDFRGVDRVKGGAPDMGAFEGPYGDNDPLTCGFSVENNLFRSDASASEVLFTGVAVGQGAATAEFAWYVDGADVPAGMGSTFAKDDFPEGFHSIELVVTPAEGEPVRYSSANCVFVYPKTIYVDAVCATPRAPYNTQETAATSIATAYDWLTSGSGALPSFGSDENDAVTFVVADGTYSVTEFYVTLPVRFVAMEGATPKIDLKKTQYGMIFQNALASIDGFTFINGRADTVMLYLGSKMSNCTFSAPSATTFNAPIVDIVNGTVDSCVFTNSTGEYCYENNVVEVRAGILKNSTFVNCGRHDSIVWVNGSDAVMSNCVVRNSSIYSGGTDNLQYRVLTLSSGLVTDCVITNSGSLSAGKSGTVYISGGTMRNCLVADNHSRVYPGVNMAGGTLESCTVARNNYNSSTDGVGRDLKQTSGTVLNCIFWNDSLVDGISTSGGTITYTLSNVLKTGEGNVAGKPFFTDASAGDYTLTDDSPARDKGVNQGWMENALDLAMTNRIINSQVDMGCYEGLPVVAKLRCTVIASVVGTEGDSLRYRFVPSVALGYEKLTDYEITWTVNGVECGTGSGPWERIFEPSGTSYSVLATAKVDDKSVGAEPIELQVLPSVFYVDAASETPEAPYSTPETAAKTVGDVIALGHDVLDTRVFHVKMAPGKYSTGGQVVTLPTAIEGTGPGVIFNSGSALTLNHDASSVSNVVFSGTSFILTRGNARDIVVRNMTNQSGGTLVTIGGGTCEGLVMTNCHTTAWNYQTGISVSGSARLSNFLMDNWGGYDMVLNVTGSAIVSNGVIRNVCGYPSDYARQDSLVYHALRMSGGLVTHCEIGGNGNTVAARDGAVRVSGGTLRNCLVAGNRSTDCAGINLSGGHLESCTVVVNDGDVLHKTGYGTYGSCLNMSGGFATNCVFYTTEAASDDWNYCRVTGGKIGNCWLSVKGNDTTPAGTGVLVGDDPCFKSAGGWDFVPSGNSPLLGKGLNQPWMTGATDFTGKRRVCGRRVDLGAFEGDARGMLLIVR